MIKLCTFEIQKAGASAAYTSSRSFGGFLGSQNRCCVKVDCWIQLAHVNASNASNGPIGTYTHEHVIAQYSICLYWDRARLWLGKVQTGRRCGSWVQSSRDVPFPKQDACLGVSGSHDMPHFATGTKPVTLRKCALSKKTLSKPIFSTSKKPHRAILQLVIVLEHTTQRCRGHEVKPGKWREPVKKKKL